MEGPGDGSAKWETVIVTNYSDLPFILVDRLWFKQFKCFSVFYYLTYVEINSTGGGGELWCQSPCVHMCEYLVRGDVSLLCHHGS